MTLRKVRAEDHAAARFPLAVKRLGTAVLIAGVATALVLAFVWVGRGRLLPAVASRPPPWGLWDVLKLGGMSAAGGIVFNAIFHAEGIRAFGGPNVWLVQLFGAVLLAGVLLHILRVERGGCLADIGLRAGTPLRDVGLGVLAFLAVQPFVHIMMILNAEAVRRGLIPPIALQESLHAMLRTRSPVTLTLACSVALVAAPVTEEMLFRGFLLPALQRWLGRAMGIAVSAAFFAAAHVDLYTLAPMFVLGVGLGYLYDRTRSLVGPVTVHVMYNAMVVLTVFAHRSLIAASVR